MRPPIMPPLKPHSILVCFKPKGMNVIYLSLLLLFVCPAPSDPAPAPAVNWMSITDLDNRMQSPKWAANEKLIFVDLYTQWCGWCKRMDNTTFTDPTIVRYLNDNFHSVRLDAETKETLVIDQVVYPWKPSGRRGINTLGEKLGTIQGRISYPTLVFLHPNFRKIQAIPGYRNADDLLPMLVYFAEEQYRKTPWDKFLAQFDPTPYQIK